MAHDGMRRTDRQARIGLEDLEGRNLQSALVGAATSGAPLIRPPASSTAEYHTTVWGSHEDLATIKGEFVSIKGESSPLRAGFVSKKL